MIHNSRGFSEHDPSCRFCHHAMPHFALNSLGRTGSGAGATLSGGGGGGRGKDLVRKRKRLTQPSLPCFHSQHKEILPEYLHPQHQITRGIWRSCLFTPFIISYTVAKPFTGQRLTLLACYGLPYAKERPKVSLFGARFSCLELKSAGERLFSLKYLAVNDGPMGGSGKSARSRICTKVSSPVRIFVGGTSAQVENTGMENLMMCLWNQGCFFYFFRQTGCNYRTVKFSPSYGTDTVWEISRCWNVWYTDLLIIAMTRFRKSFNVT
ncbi:hypothetical protein RRG08_010161 [Elysia crispata]|uniref:Uncharacterized protein n=1 Tax=Elysia crispata TaxID=231223 RepID=A0AAE1DZX2_9GAST|nr:hypothetical protein RRG08_010161 [Elysia crispata]